MVDNIASDELNNTTTGQLVDDLVNGEAPLGSYRTAFYQEGSFTTNGKGDAGEDNISFTVSSNVGGKWKVTVELVEDIEG